MNEVKTAREKLELTMEELAEELGVSYHTVFRWENKRWPIPKMAKLAIETLLRKKRK